MTEIITIKEKSAICTANMDKVDKLAESVPLFSEAVQQAQQLINQPELDISRIVHVLESDLSLTANVLRIANSPFYGLSGKIASIREACMVLGQHTLRNLFLSAAVLGICKQHVLDKAQFEPLWLHFLHTAVIARNCAPKVEINEDIAYTAGLLHDIGSLFLYVLMPEEIMAIQNKIKSENFSLVEAEIAVLGFDHSDLSGSITQRWKLPVEISTAIYSHHAPSQNVDKLADLIHMADAISNWRKSDDSQSVLYDRIHPDVITRMGISEDKLADFLEDCPTISHIGEDILLND